MAHAVTVTANFVKAQIASMVVSTVVFVGCDVTLGIPTGGVGAVAVAAAWCAGWHDPAVDISTFWDIIETARASAGPDRPFHETLADHLATLTEQDILEYRERFEEVSAALYRCDVWAAAYLIGGGCSDDSFMDFRAGLIAQGRDWYQMAAASPDSLASHPAVAGAVGRPRDNPLFYERVNYAASRAFRRVSGDEHAFWDALEARGQPDRSPPDMGEDFDFDDDQEMRRRLPRLSACCLGNSSA